MRTVPRLLALLAAFAAIPLQAAITGSVMNADGQPIAAAKVAIFSPETLFARRERLMSKAPQRDPLVTATSDSNGNFRVEPPKEKTVVELRIDATGYAPETMRVQNDDEAGAIVLVKAEPKSGVIKAPDGKPLAGATVIWGGGAELTTTDANGRYTAPDPSKWAGRLLVIHPDYARLDEQFMGTNRREMNYTLQSGVKVTGKVVGDDGTTGVADAAISIDGWPAGKSGADGTFTIEHAPKGWEQIRAVSGSRVAAHVAAGPLTLKLVKGATITGTIKDAKTQLPVVGAEVQLGTGGVRLMGGGALFDSVQTDAKGNFTLTSLSPGNYSVNASRPNYIIPNANAAVTVGQTQAKPIFATAVARVSGTVLDEDKRPVAAARVAAQAAGRGEPMMLMGRPGMNVRAAYSGPDGRFVARVGELDTDVNIAAMKKGYPATKSPIMRLASGERKSGVNLVIPRGVAFSGRVIDKSGKPVSGVAVDASEAQGDVFGGQVRRIMRGIGNPRDDDDVKTASDGTFTVRLKEGKYDVVFRREGYAAKTLRAQSVAANAKPVEVVLDPGVEISGRVVRGGVGIEGVNINTMAEGGMANAVTASDGSFTLTDLTPGQMMLIASKMDAMIQEIRPVTAPAHDLVIDIPAGGRITGRVVDKTSHQPITSFQAGVTTTRGAGGMMIMTPPMMKSFNSDDGTFVLENVKAGPTQVVANAAGYTTGRATTVEVEEGKTVNDVEVPLEAGAKLAGKVTDASGVPVTGVSVRAEVTGGATRVMRFDGADSSAVTDPNGDYTIDSVEPGEKTFTFNKSGYPAETRTVTLASGKETRVDVTLSSGVRVGGLVVTEAGTPVSEATVRVQSGATFGGREAHTDSSGGFQFEGLAPGHYTFSATKAGMANGFVRDVDIATTNNVRIVMAGGGVISGHVNGLSASEMEQATVTAASANGNASAPVDAAGNFRVEGAPTGTVRVSARTGQIFGGSSKSAAPKTVQLDPGGSAQVDIEFKSDTVIRGRVIRNGQSVANANVIFVPRQGKAQTVSNTTADANGRYEISGLDDGPYNVQVVDMERAAPYTTTYDVHGSGNFDIEVRTSALRGRVVDATTGEAISEAQVEIKPRSADGGGFFGARAVPTDASGSFIFPEIASGTYQVSADKDGYGHDVKEISVGDSTEPIEFKLSPSAGVTLKVVDGRDGRMLEANIRVTDAQGRDVGGTGPIRFGGGGAEPVKLALSPGTYRVTAQAMGYAPRTLLITSPSNQTIALTPGGTLLIRSKSSGPARARLIDSSGAPYFTNTFNTAGTFMLPASPGVATLQNVAAGHYRLDLLDVNDAVLQTIEVDVLEGQTATYDL